MKKLFALLLAMMMVACLAACGETEEPADDTGSDSQVSDSQVTEPAESVTILDSNGNEVSEETIQELTEAYNAIAIPYNEIATAVNENGWMADEQTAAEMEALGETMGFIGAGLTEDLTMLEGTDFEALISTLTTELPPALEELSARVSVPYEG